MRLGEHVELDRKRTCHATVREVSTLIEVEVSSIGIDASLVLDMLGKGNLRAVAESALLTLY